MRGKLPQPSDDGSPVAAGAAATSLVNRLGCPS
jgi:hypothetical protein